VPNRRNSAAVEDCLKVIFSVGEWDERGRTVGEIAARLRASTSTVSELVRRLTDEGLVEHERYGNVALTDAGLTRALMMVRRHRLIETYLVRELEYRWDEVHDEAEVLEHAISDLMLDRMDSRLGQPWRDPHGDAIPTPDAVLHLPGARPLAELDEGHSGFIVRILDEDPDLLRWFSQNGVALDVEVTVLESKPFGGALEIGLGPTPISEGLDLGVQAVASLWVSDAPPLPGVIAPFTCHYEDCRHIAAKPIQ
jgi:DtxR family Mn-dependent transcriptional regulator